MNLHVLLIGFLQTSNQKELFSNEGCINGGGFNIVSIPENAIGPNIRIPSPGNPSAYFAPISPAAKTSNLEELTNSTSSKNPLMDILRVGSSSNDGNDIEGKKIVSFCRYTRASIGFLSFVSLSTMSL